jgi:uncharacterized coiled-coil protein SlyX
MERTVTDALKDPSIEQRITAFGAQLTEQAEAISGLRSTTAWQNTVLGELKTAIQGLSDKLANVGRPQYSMIISGCVLVIMIGGIFGSGYVRDQTRIETEVVAGRQKAIEDAYGRGQTDAKISGNTAELVRIASRVVDNAEEIRTIHGIATRNQERISQLLSEFKETTSALDTRLQREMRDLDGTMIERINGLRERVDRVQARTDENSETILNELPRSLAERARLEERIKCVENTPRCKCPLGAHP